MTPLPATSLACAGCGARVPAGSSRPFRCPRAGPDGVDHVVAKRLDPRRVRFPTDGDANPFVRYRELFHSYHVARRGGFGDADYVTMVRRLDRDVAEVDGAGFRVTPFAHSAALSERLGFSAPGGVWVKDETGNVGGSHKGRHLMGVALHLEVLERLGRATPEAAGGPRLAIASCGNAALAAAVIARAAGRSLDVFVPAEADPGVLDRLASLRARVEVCRRPEGSRGDPCLARFRAAVDAGAVPFGCQGSENGLSIEGGETLGYEMVSALRAEGARLDRLFVQVGGGALASACVQAFRAAVSLGVAPAAPRIHAVQTEGAFPLRRAYDRVRDRILARLPEMAEEGGGGGATREGPRGGAVPAGGGLALGRAGAAGLVDEEAVAELLRGRTRSTPVEEALCYAARHRSEFMWPWEETRRSVASGILDDETYDWHAVVSGTIESGGWPLVVSEPTLREAHDLARAATGIRVSHTGAAGLAGLIELRRSGSAAPGELVAVLFTGVER